MQLSRSLIIASYLSIFLCFITSDSSATRGARSTAEPGIGTHQQGQDKVVAATTGAFGFGESDRHSAEMTTRLSSLPIALLAPPQGALTNGATHTGVIQVGGTDTWTIDAAFNDSITVRIGEVTGAGADPNFYPRVRLIRPDGLSSDDDYGQTNAAEVFTRAQVAGTYTVLVSQHPFNTQSGTGSYILTVAKTPGPYTISSGDQGGQITNGATHTGLIPVGDMDTWYIDAAFNDSITVRIGEVTGAGADPNFYPRVRLIRPDGLSSDDDYGQTNAAEVFTRAQVAGTYTVLVSQHPFNTQSGTGSYILTVAKTPGPYTISSGDQGGQITNGATHTGLIPVGDMDTWYIDAAFNDSITVRIGEVTGVGPDPNFLPRLRLIRPDGLSAGDDFGETNAAEVSTRAVVAGTYTVLVSNREGFTQFGPGNYMLTLAKTPGPYSISSGDEGGLMTNGTTHTGAIPVGDMDTWNFDAAFNDSITVRIGEVTGVGPDPNFLPRLRLIRPDGLSADDEFGETNAAEVSTRAVVAGTYTVLVSNREGFTQFGPGNYMLTLAKTPGPYSISSGDEGGLMTNGTTHTGAIPVGDMDTWNFDAAFNDSITVRIGEVTGVGPDPNFLPRLRLIRPDGLSLGDDFGETNAAEVSTRAVVAGTYTVLVSNREGFTQFGPGNYMLTLAKTPGPYSISSGDEGGLMTNGTTHTGAIPVGDMDTWNFDAAFNDSITVRIGEVTGVGPDPNFLPRLRLIRPDGLSLGDDFGETNAAEVSTRAVVAGTYTVLVSNREGFTQFGPGNYILTLAKTPGPYSISSGDEGGPLINGAQAGVIGVGDVDAWSFQATLNSAITLSLGEVAGGGPDPNFLPRLRLIRPDGLSLGDDFGSSNSAQISVSAPLTGMYTVLVSNREGFTQSGPGNYTLTFSGPPQPSISISNVTQIEGNIGTTAFTFNVTLSGQTFQTVTVNYATANGTAIAPSDYTAIPSTQLAFNPGDPLTKTVTVLVNGDTSVEPNETFFINLSGALGITVSNAQGTGTINNDDNAGTILFTSATYSVNENGGSATITATRLVGSSGAVSVQYATSNGTATAGQDYTAASGTLNWADGDTAAKTFNVPITDDGVFEGNETVNLALSAPTGGATLGTPNTAVLTIVETKGNQTITFNALANKTFGDAPFNVSASSSSGLPVSFSIVSGPATISANTITITGVGVVTVRASQAGDANFNAATSVDRSFTVEAGSTGSIQFAGSNYSVAEDGVSATITVTRFGDTSAAAVSFRTVDGSTFPSCKDFNGLASPRCDHAPTSGTLTFNPGVSSQTFTVLINNDAFAEGNETVDLALSNPTNGMSLGTPATATLTILDDDPVTPAANQMMARLRGSEVVPATSSNATGTAMLTVTSATSADISLSFSGLGSAQTAAHIHGPAPFNDTQAAPVIATLPNGTVSSFALNNLTATQVAELKGGLWYVDVHSSGLPNGEIRASLLGNPLEDPRVFVAQQFIDFLGRAPVLDFWVGELTRPGGVPVRDPVTLARQRLFVTNAFFYSTEFQRSGAFVFRLYRAAYGNNQPFPNERPDIDSDPVCVAHGCPVKRLDLLGYARFAVDFGPLLARATTAGQPTPQGSQALAQYESAQAFVQRAEFLARYPASQTGPQFVDALLATMLSGSGVNLPSGERDKLVTHFNNGGRALVMFHVANDYWNGCAVGDPAVPVPPPCVPPGPTTGGPPGGSYGAAVDLRPFIDAEYNKAFVATQFYGYFRRDADLPGYNFWLRELTTLGGQLRDQRRQQYMECNQINSGEYQERFGFGLTRTADAVQCPFPTP